MTNPYHFDDWNQDALREAWAASLKPKPEKKPAPVKRPPSVQDRIAALMSDGRWRTGRDMAVALGEPAGRCSLQAGKMRRAGLLVEDRLHTTEPRMWRAKTQEAAE